MPLPGFSQTGDLPLGVHRATLDEVVGRFGAGSSQREDCTRRLIHVYDLAKRTDRLHRFVVFGSYVTAKTDPNDVDVAGCQSRTHPPAPSLKEEKGWRESDDSNTSLSSKERDRG